MVSRKQAQGVHLPPYRMMDKTEKGLVQGVKP